MFKATKPAGADRHPQDYDPATGRYTSHGTTFGPSDERYAEWERSLITRAASELAEVSTFAEDSWGDFYDDLFHYWGALQIVRELGGDWDPPTRGWDPPADAETQFELAAEVAEMRAARFPGLSDRELAQFKAVWSLFQAWRSGGVETAFMEMVGSDEKARQVVDAALRVSARLLPEGVGTVRLFRGAGGKETDDLGDGVWAPNGFTSWALREETAERFTSFLTPTVLSVDVPASEVIGWWAGFGSFVEAEVVVPVSVLPDRVSVARSGGDRPTRVDVVRVEKATKPAGADRHPQEYDPATGRYTSAGGRVLSPEDLSEFREQLRTKAVERFGAEVAAATSDAALIRASAALDVLDELGGASWDHRPLLAALTEAGLVRKLTPFYPDVLLERLGERRAQVETLEFLAMSWVMGGYEFFTEAGLLSDGPVREALEAFHRVSQKLAPEGRITVYRGCGPKEIGAINDDEWDANLLTSWSSDRGKAADFALQGMARSFLETTVDAKDVMFGWWCGLANPGEMEVVMRRDELVGAQIVAGGVNGNPPPRPVRAVGPVWRGRPVPVEDTDWDNAVGAARIRATADFLVAGSVDAADFPQLEVGEDRQFIEDLVGGPDGVPPYRRERVKRVIGETIGLMREAGSQVHEDPVWRGVSVNPGSEGGRRLLGLRPGDEVTWPLAASSPIRRVAEQFADPHPGEVSMLVEVRGRHKGLDSPVTGTDNDDGFKEKPVERVLSGRFRVVSHRVVNGQHRVVVEQVGDVSTPDPVVSPGR